MQREPIEYGIELGENDQLFNFAPLAIVAKQAVKQDNGFS